MSYVKPITKTERARMLRACTAIDRALATIDAIEPWKQGRLSAYHSEMDIAQARDDITRGSKTIKERLSAL